MNYKKKWSGGQIKFKLSLAISPCHLIGPGALVIRPTTRFCKYLNGAVHFGGSSFEFDDDALGCCLLGFGLVLHICRSHHPNHLGFASRSDDSIASLGGRSASPLLLRSMWRSIHPLAVLGERHSSSPSTSTLMTSLNSPMP